jgi:hypothetical protein
MYYSFVNSKQSLDYLDNNILIPIWNEYMYYNQIRRHHIEKNLKFARFPPKLIPFPDHLFDTFNGYPQPSITFPYFRLRRINGFDYLRDSWTDHFKWDRMQSQKHYCISYIYWTLMTQWVHFGHKGHYFDK